MKEIIKEYQTEQEKISMSIEEMNEYFNQGHPPILLGLKRGDVWLMLLELMETEIGTEIYDQNGGEFDIDTLSEENEIINIKYILYDISIDEEDVPKNYIFELQGFFVEVDEMFEEFFVTRLKYHLF